MRESVKVSITDPSIREIVKTCFPEYRGRKIRVSAGDSPVDVRSYWDEGSRQFFMAIELRSCSVMYIPQNGTPFDGGPIRPDGVIVPPGFAIVQHSIYSGKDCGITIHVHPDTMPKFLK